MTTAEQLESVQNAIAAIEDGVQSYRMGDETATMADLGSLYAREKTLKAALARKRRRKSTFTSVNFPGS